MLHKGFYLKVLRIIGPNLPPAEVTFEKGLNVISGASNTGKSYIFECINYVLGGEKQPKSITEAAGYVELRLQINTYDGKEFTLAREFNGSKIRFNEVNIDKYDSQSSQEINARKGSLNTDISWFLLDLVGLDGRKLRKDKYNAKKELSFRDLVKFCMIDEQQIISPEAPIYSGQFTTRTVEESLFNLILSGTDDESLAQLEDPKIYRQKIIGKLDFIEYSISRKRKELEGLKKYVGNLEDEQINYKIDEFTTLINDSYKLVLDEEKKRQEIWDSMEKTRVEIGHMEELEKRFNLLDMHYNSDLDRLEFINEGSQYLGQVEEKECPICGKLMGKEIFDKVFEYDNKIISTSLNSEVKKIQIKQADLKDTIKELVTQKEALNDIFKGKALQFNKIDTEIQNKLRPLIAINRTNLEKFLDLREKKSKISITDDEIRSLNSDMDFYKAELSKKEKVALKRAIATDYYILLQEEIGKVLADWKTGYSSVYFEKETNDLKLDGKLRSEFGKGFRALIRAAFMVGLLKYCLGSDKFHPFFLILDSPLTAYQKKDNKEEALSEDIENAFFKSLADYCNSKDLQIIVLENKEPSKILQKHIKYYHFSGNPAFGRYGFYPIIENQGKLKQSQ